MNKFNEGFSVAWQFSMGFMGFMVGGLLPWVIVLGLAFLIGVIGYRLIPEEK